ncbi:MAG: hypothetical protein NT069_17645 [Planctomycetota bacterium]|nr:hypothetical protein [Planctomycetota bacterium]
MNGFTWKRVLSQCAGVHVERRLGEGAENARIESLDRQDAVADIDRQWWQGIRPTVRANESDGHWPWMEIAGKHRSWKKACACLRTADSWIQSAIAYDLHGSSLLDKGDGCVFVDFLATAPWNRPRITSLPLYRGCGTELLVHVVAESYSNGLHGRVALIPIEDDVVEYYEDFGFRTTGVECDDRIVFKLPVVAALELLKQRGLLDE